MLAVFRSLIKAFPDFRFEARHIVSAGDTVVAELTMSGTHRGTPDLPGCAISLRAHPMRRDLVIRSR